MQKNFIKMNKAYKNIIHWYYRYVIVLLNKFFYEFLKLTFDTYD